MHVLICGGGVIGASLAYFLSVRGVEATVVERTGLACAASGKSGGFLARDWCDGTPLAALARRSFDLHAELNDRLEGDWGYRRLTTYAGAAGPGFGLRGGGHALGWLADGVAIDQRLGSPETTAQVHPERFTAALMAAAQARGAVLRTGRVEGLVRRGDSVAGVVVDGAPVGADAVVIAMGPWSILAAQWLALPGVYGLKGHSLVFETGARVPPESLFLDYRDETGAAATPEVFPRNDGTTYICGISSDSALPVDPAAVAADPGALERLEALCRTLSPVLADAPIHARQACYRPVTRDGLPLIGAVPSHPGAYVATGHSVWGILNAPATGEAMADLLVEGAAGTVDLSPFDPARLAPLDPAELRS